MIKFIHTGDLHLGFKFLNPSFKGDLAKRRRRELWSTFERIIQYAIDERVDFLLIAGDLFEEAYFNIGDIRRVRDILKRALDINVVLVAGNHDYIGRKSLYKRIEWTDNVYIFDTDRIGKIEFPALNTNIYGYSWDRKEIRENTLFKNLKDDMDPSKNNILLLHGDLYGASNYLPLNLDDLKSLNMDYIALGHIHKPEIIERNIAYCGCPEPLDFGEQGERGIIEGIIEDKKTDINFKAFSQRKFIEKDLELKDQMTYFDILEEIKNIDIEGQNRNFYRLKLEGYIDKYVSLKDIEEDLKDDFYHLEIKDNTRLDYDLDMMEKENNNIIGEFIKTMKDKGLDDPLVKDALYIGLEALLKERN